MEWITLFGVMANLFLSLTGWRVFVLAHRRIDNLIDAYFRQQENNLHHMDMTVLDHRSRETLRRYEEGEFTKDPPKPGVWPNTP